MNNSLHIDDSLIGLTVKFSSSYDTIKGICTKDTGIIRACFVADNILIVIIEHKNGNYVRKDITDCEKFRFE